MIGPSCTEKMENSEAVNLIMLIIGAWKPLFCSSKFLTESIYSDTNYPIHDESALLAI